MDKQQAKYIIQETFENPFERERFIGFIKNLLNRIEEATFTYQGQFIPDAYKGYISSLERIGKFNDGENRIDVLIIKLQKETSLERARTMQRNFVAWYLNGSRGGELKEAALVAFVSPDEEDWRFSLVKMDYKFEQTKTGRMKVMEDFTPARRWSFLVGKNETSHTAQSRLVNMLANDEHSPTIKELENAFDIETVTKEFFIKYRELFIRTKEDLDKVEKNDAKIKADFEAKGVNTVDFAKKLLGQIIFLYFLQKKGWFGVARDAEWGTGSKHFLRELFEKKHSGYKNFFNDILEPLFYEALRVGEERKQDDYYYSRFNCKIPFLNGGLFDPIGNNGGYDWVHTDICLPDSLFSNKNKTKEGDEGDGILDIFDRYNFTVREDEPLEKEVAIDPELLGKAYEKFNAIRPDNFEEYKKALKSGKKGEESKFNKQYGVYYTPPEIVHYMCQQSLINYLCTQLNNGIVVYEKLDEKQLYMFGNEGKKGQLDLIIEYGSKLIIPKEDIETLIHLGEQVSENEEIALFKEQKILEGKQKSSDYKLKLPESIRKNASLIDQKLADITVCDPAVGSGAFPVGMMSEIVKARIVLSTFIKEENRTTYDFKHQCIEKSLYGVDIDPGAVEIAKLRLWLSLVVDEDDIKNIKPLPNLDYKIVCGNSLLGVEKNLFNDKLFKELERLKPLLFNETNPTKKQDCKKQIDGLISQITNGHKEFDFEIYFSEVFHHKGGFDVVIGNPPYGETIKESKDYFRDAYCCTEGKFEIYKYFIEKGLRLLAQKAVLTFITPDTWLTLGYFQKLRKMIFEKHSLLQVTESLYKVFDSATVDTMVFLIQGNNNGSSRQATTIISPDLITLRQLDLVLNDQFEINLQNVNRVVKKLDQFPDTFDIYCEIWQGLIAYHSKDQPRKFSSTQKDTHHHRKLLYGGDIGKYLLQWSGEWLKYGDWLHRPRPAYIFDNPKILVQRIRNPQLPTRIVATVDYDKYINGTGLSNLIVRDEFINKMNIKFLLGIINSSLVNYWFSYYFKDVNIKPEQLRKIPVALPDEETRNTIVSLVDRILATKQKDPDADTSVLERQIDQMVYKLYGLTEEEIKIV